MRYVKYTPEYKEEAIRLLQMLWSHLDERGQRELFAWRYENNPFAETPWVYLAMHNNMVVGFRGFVPQNFVFGKNTELKGFTPADAIVHPGYRRQGVLTKLNHIFFDDIDQSFSGRGLIYNLSSNKFSTPGYLKQHWQATNGIKRFALRTSLPNYFFIKTKTPKEASEGSSLISDKGWHIDISSSVRAAEMALCYENCRPTDKICNIRDERYFRWRYAYLTEAYIFACLLHDDVMTAYLVLRKVSDYQYLLWEYAVPGHKELKILVQTAMRERTIPFLRGWVLSGSETSLLGRCGFLAAPVRLWQFLGKERLPVLVRPLQREPSESDFFVGTADIRKIDHWQLFLADRH
ncbi:MAG: GNAT family N-acetyltransferase [Bacteroidia bacterium]|nr:MAG: GNAT family N-acetyltransferase [Bacteroidia bacterium]